MALGLGKVLACGQVRLPRDVRRASDIKPGDTVSFRVNNGVVEIRPLPCMTLEESLKLFRIEGPVDIAAMREEAEAAEADEVIRVMMRNTPRNPDE
jgi:AbrB family looped-hinge helix DNA binding protein